MKIGVLLIATQKYIQFVDPVVDSIRTRFFRAEEVTIFLFTDREVTRKDVVPLPIVHKPWPNITLERFHIFSAYRQELEGKDYLFYLDVDMKVVGEVGPEILPEFPQELVGTIHPGFYSPGKRGSYETRPESTAYIGSDQGTTYYAGGFNGGTATAFLNMAESLSHNIDIDRKKGITAVWHDESHLNRYLLDRPVKNISPAYCYPESWKIPFPKLILALDKDHAALRKESQHKTTQRRNLDLRKRTPKYQDV